MKNIILDTDIKDKEELKEDKPKETPIEPKEVEPRAQPKVPITFRTTNPSIPIISNLPYPQRAKRRANDTHMEPLIKALKDMVISLSFTDALQYIPLLHKFIKDHFANKKRIDWREILP